MAISKVCSFGWRLCQRFGKIAWNKYGALSVTVLVLASSFGDHGKCFSELGGLIIRLLQVDETDSVRLYEMGGWLILASGMEVVKFLFSNIPVRATTMKDPTQPWGGGSLVRGTPPLDPNPDGPVLGPDGEGESSMMVGPLHAPCRWRPPRHPRNSR